MQKFDLRLYANKGSGIDKCVGVKSDCLAKELGSRSLWVV
ncbi:hypothetical protein SAMN04488136_103134 [Vibrio xiamenensis]|uniref:Uncharacterized protein n=1 Tax=Vibrio xiamenensis TaxID=861298 RepID=A0A1G7XFZ6_9VIBR|nr:hypothetical protein SAMN04488136_103134 [Vibrio xiamenensis]